MPDTTKSIVRSFIVQQRFMDPKKVYHGFIPIGRRKADIVNETTIRKTKIKSVRSCEKPILASPEQESRVIDYNPYRSHVSLDLHPSSMAAVARKLNYVLPVAISIIPGRSQCEWELLTRDAGVGPTP
jgi:hypothetical protein